MVNGTSLRQSLTTLNLARATISDTAVEALATRCLALQSLDLTRCHFLTDAAFQAIASLPALQSLILAVSDFGALFFLSPLNFLSLKNS